jgi:hypothetical protein
MAALVEVRPVTESLPTGMEDLEPDPELCVGQETLQEADWSDIADRADVDVDVVEAVLEALAEFECERNPVKNPRTLARLYYVEELTQREIGDRLGCSHMSVSLVMNEYGINPGVGGSSQRHVFRENGGESA